MTELPTIPVTLRVHLAHATLQAIAEECGADMLHIKGPAVDPSLRPEGRSSVDADVLVRPSHFERFLDGLRRFGWHEVTRMTSGGVVEHSTNWYHGELGQVDVHVRFPGIQIEAERAFDRLWEGRCTQDIGHSPCSVPSLVAQRLILLLHAARGERDADVEVAWTNLAEVDRDRVSALAGELRADVALAAATGRLEDFRDRPEYGLWRLFASGEYATGVLAAMAAHAKAAPAGVNWIHLRTVRHMLHLVRNKRKRLAAQLHREPTRAELIGGYFGMLLRGPRMLSLRFRPNRSDWPSRVAVSLTAGWGQHSTRTRIGVDR